MSTVDINLQTKVADLLEAYPGVESELLALSPAFQKLRNPVLRRTVARMTSLQQAARVADIDPSDMIARLRKAAGLPPTDIGIHTEETDGEEMPPWYAPERVVKQLDAAALIEKGDVPLQPILQAAHSLQAGQVLVVKTPFRTVPVVDRLRQQGFRVWVAGEHKFAVSPS